MNHIHKTILVFSVLIILQHCKSNNIKQEKGVFINKTKEYVRDSLFINYTMKEFMKNGYHTLRGYELLGTYPKVVCNIDTILYDKDSLKLFALVINKAPNYDRRNNQIIDGFYFDETAVIGFRENKQQIWKMYLFDRYIPSGWSTYEEVRNLMCRFYFNEFKNRSEYILDDKENWIGAVFGYNVNDTKFWTESIVWKKGLRIPGLYNFQTVGNVKPSDTLTREVEDIPPIPQYPDFLLSLF